MSCVEKQPTPDPRPTKLISPEKKARKWSAGVAPSDYGASPTTSKLRKYWGGENEDPLTSDDYIWNSEFVDRMKKLIQDPNADAVEDSSLQSSPVKLHFSFHRFICLILTMGEEPSGFLSLNRVMSLATLEIDLSKELTSPSKPVLVLQQDVEFTTQDASIVLLSRTMFRELRRPQGDPELLAAQSRNSTLRLFE
ncbi:Phosphoenolpyruvate carboxylase 3 isoform 1 [Hibiscus syriacus]|uniref:Phosphoenolpyruvate carboxylase 3 isoform 1 n=1 Tax=Hibiscus syriacus TaxID=106335 RepID=A0A6A3A9F6_HIBSY|nr:Phosphoenolpyruvate carboxylase 3 isoform 1 [Hibiscus syriacus]